MSTLYLSQHAQSILERCYNKNLDLGKWLVYRTSSIPAKDVTNICHLAMKTYNDRHLREPESDLEELSFVTPAQESSSGPCENFDDVFGSHIRMLGSILDEGSSDPFNDYKIYPLGFIVASENWRERGVMVVHCDKDRGVWKVGRCRILVDELGLPLTSVSDGDESFDPIRQRYSSIDEGGTTGGPVPIGDWQFALFSTAMPGGLAKEVVHDPRADSFPPEETSFDLIPSQGMEWEKVLETFVLDYARCVWEPVLPNGEERPLKRHPNLFVVVDSPRPEQDGVLIVKMIWDMDLNKLEGELRESARRSKVETRRCHAYSALSTLRVLDEM